MDLTPDEVALLKTVRNGADIFGLGTARKFRALSKKAPHLLTICDVMGEYPGAHQQPYFGAIATADGKALLDETTRTPTARPGDWPGLGDDMPLIRYTAVEYVMHSGRTTDEILNSPPEWRDIGPAYVDPAYIIGIAPDNGCTMIVLSDAPMGILKLRAMETPEQIRAKMDAAGKHRRGRGK